MAFVLAFRAAGGCEQKGKITLSALLLVEQNARSADARKSAFDGSGA
jgi:hypothetical protein